MSNQLSKWLITRRWSNLLTQLVEQEWDLELAVLSWHPFCVGKEKKNEHRSHSEGPIPKQDTLHSLGSQKSQPESPSGATVDPSLQGQVLFVLGLSLQRRAVRGTGPCC